MQAILTRILPATNFRPTRIKASCQRGSAIYSYDCLGNSGFEAAHILAAERLCHSFAVADSKEYQHPIAASSWKRPFQTGALPNGDFAHVFIS